jgi:hypothetical protein
VGFFKNSLTGSHSRKAKVFGESLMDNILNEVDPLILDADKFKQRAAGELVLALLRGSLGSYVPEFSLIWWSRFQELASKKYREALVLVQGPDRPNLRAN